MFGFDSLKDMFDGGGAGQSGDSFSTEGSVFDRDGVNNYTDKGGTGAVKNNYSSDSFVSNTFSDTTNAVKKVFSPNTDYVIKSGDTLSEIAAANGTTVDALMKANPKITDPNKIYAGGTLNIPKSGGGASSTSTGNDNGGSGGSSGSGAAGSGSSGDAAGGSGTGELSADNILAWAKKAGVVKSDAEIEAMIADPNKYLQDKGINLADFVNDNGVLIDPETLGTSLDPDNPNYQLGDSPAYTATTVDDISTTSDPGQGPVTTYTADTVAEDIAGNAAATVDAVTGTIDDDNLVDADEFTIDMKGSATGVNEDGSINEVGEALNDYAFVDMSKVIDTSTVEGKLLADKLAKEGRDFVDAKTSILWQMKTISAEFKDANGNPKIPTWAQGLAREVNRTMAFNGITGTAATAALSNAIMEATLGIAEKEATFFQTLTTKNLDNKQQAIINKANVLSKFEIANLDARQAAAVQNAKAFLEMDLTNLTREQEAEVINTQAMVDALFNDQAATNAARIFSAEAANDFQKFYDELAATVSMHNDTQLNAMKKFNAGEINDAAQFNADMEDGRQRFYAEMQYNIDTANMKWRQEVVKLNSSMLYDAYAEDVKNSYDLNQEGLNRLWDRVDSILDYIYKGAATEAELDARILAAEISAAASSKGGSSGIWGAIGQIGAAVLPGIISSDERLKENVEYHGVIGGLRTYTWDWNEKAVAIGYDKYPTVGVLAQEVQKSHPEAVFVGPEGYLMVNYGKIQ